MIKPKLSHPDHWLNLEYTKNLSQTVMGFFREKYFRVEFYGLENIPEKRPALLIQNHSGMGMPWDAAMFVDYIFQAKNYARKWFVRGFAEPWFFKIPFFNQWGPRFGMYPAKWDSFPNLLDNDELVLYYPEGVPGIGKGWHRRYQLQEFHTSFLKFAVQHKAQIIPTVCVGAELTHPFAFNWAWGAKKIGIPFLPLSPLLLSVIPFISNLPFSLPVKLIYYVGKPIDVSQLDTTNWKKKDWQEYVDLHFKKPMQDMLDAGKQKYWFSTKEQRESLAEELCGQEEIVPIINLSNEKKYKVSEVHFEPFKYKAYHKTLMYIPWMWISILMDHWNHYLKPKNIIIYEERRKDTDKPRHYYRVFGKWESVFFLFPFAWIVPIAVHLKKLIKTEPLVPLEKKSKTTILEEKEA